MITSKRVITSQAGNRIVVTQRFAKLSSYVELVNKTMVDGKPTMVRV